MDNITLIKELRAALSWELAKPASNPAYQAVLEHDRSKNRRVHVNPLGIRTPEFQHLFKD